MTKKFLILFILASLTGHALVIALTARIDMRGSPRTEKVMNVELKMSKDVQPTASTVRKRAAAPPVRAAARVDREDSVALQNPGGPYEPYILQVRRKIESRWAYPPQALSERQEGDTVIRFTIDAGGALSDYYVTSSSGSPRLDEGALAVVRDASPFAAIPEAFQLSRLHVTATFSYRLNP